MGRLLTFIAAGILTGSALTGCNTSGCTDLQSSIPLAGFYSSASQQAISVNNLEIYGVGAPGDSILYSGGTALREVYLPLRSDFASTSFCFHYTQEGLDDDALNDTITFHYTSEPYFASEECGAMYRYTITRLSYTQHLIDSVAVTDSLVTNTDIERLKIYFRTE